MHLASCPHLPRHGCVLVQGQVGPNLVIIFLIQKKQMAKMPFAKDYNMVKTVRSDRADQPLHVSVLPCLVAPVTRIRILMSRTMFFCPYRGTKNPGKGGDNLRLIRFVK